VIVIWGALAEVGIHRNDPSTWTTARPEHLQHLKADTAFRAIGSACTIQAIEEALEGQPWQKPRDWGAFFLQFPIGREWDVPSKGWHIDGDYTGRLVPPSGVKVHAMLTDVEPRCGGANVLSGSHRLVHRWFSETPQKARRAQLRKSLERHPYLQDLYTAGSPQARIAGFTNVSKKLMGYRFRSSRILPLAGDVILMHSLLLHAGAPAAHLGTQPRFLLNQDIHEPYW
jgi:hypothetical protein